MNEPVVVYYTIKWMKHYERFLIDLMVRFLCTDIRTMCLQVCTMGVHCSLVIYNVIASTTRILEKGMAVQDREGPCVGKQAHDYRASLQLALHSLRATTTHSTLCIMLLNFVEAPSLGISYGFIIPCAV